jgi:hypothetical protein
MPDEIERENTGMLPAQPWKSLTELHKLCRLEPWQLQPDEDCPGFYIQCVSVEQRMAIMGMLGAELPPYVGPAREGIEAQHAHNDIFPGDPYPPGPED